MQKETIRLQKFLAERGVASRRSSASVIASGRVSVNGTVIREPGFPIHPQTDSVSLDGKPLPQQKEARRTILFYKPRGYICSTAEDQGETVYSLLRDITERVVPVGRLDKDSEGLLLMSNDGDLVLRLTHPSFEQEKTYRVSVSGEVSTDVLRKLRSPFIIDDYRTCPALIRVLGPSEKPGRTILEIILREGRNRQIRHMCDQCGLKIHRLARMKIKNLTLRGLEPGQWRDLTKEELSALH